jgi:integrase/recombinase XerC
MTHHHVAHMTRQHTTRNHRPQHPNQDPLQITAVTHLIEDGYDPRFVQVLLSPQKGVHDVQHEVGTGGNLCGGGGYLRPSITRIPRRFDACAAGCDARFVG